MLIKKHILTLLIVSLFSHVSYAQKYKNNGSTDYENAQKTYNTLVDVDDSKLGKALNGSDSLIKAGEINGNYHVSCLGYSLKGRMYYRIGKFNDAITQITKWKELASKNSDDKEYFTSYYYHCDYEKYVNSAKALVMGQKMIAEAKQKKYMPGLALAHEVQGNLALYILQDYPTSTSHYKAAIDIKKKLPNNIGPGIDRLYYRLASSLGEEHKYAESEKVIDYIKSHLGNNLSEETKFYITAIQLDNAYNAKVDAGTFNQMYQKMISNPLYAILYGRDTRLFYKIRWLIRTNRGREALVYIHGLSIPLDRAMLKADAYESLNDWYNASIMKDSIEITIDSMMHDMRKEEFSALDEEMKNSELAIESAENQARYQHVLFGSIFIIFIITLAVIANYLYRRRKHKLERERDLFVRNITHQLRTPMTVVTGMVEQLKDHIPTDDYIGLENLEATKRQSRKLQELIMQLARMSNKGVTPITDVQEDLTTSTVHATPSAENKATPSLITDDNKPSILLAEDTDDVAMMMYRLLQDNGYVVTRAVDGQEALEILQHDLPDLLITDVAMPRMDGLELMRTIRKDDTMCHLPIIVASARVEDSERMEGISAGAEVYLTKPFIPEELLLSISTMLEQRKRLRHSFMNLPIDNKDGNTDVPQMNDMEQNFMKTLDKCIDDNIASKDVNASFIADLMCTSVSTINRKIKNITGMPVVTYIRSRRILKAKKMLLTTNKSISDIEISCGFSTNGHFSRTFRTETGMTPSEYRQKCMNA